jgi:mannose-6-phosphate isomerase-like protein (cupin superfamily)
VTTEKPKGGDGIMTGVQYINADSRPNPTRIWMATINTLPPGAGLAFHAHEVNEECFFILEGDAVYTDGDGKEYPITKGDFTLCRQGEKHGIYNKSSAPLVFAAVIMDSGQ